ncbi:hypothetical protein CDD80_5790 [Ophiocordyceps camponoti-rufipedis]|uniref:Uncharacterized protein n=1 Tax=Ophiocordyceps camponoti-rufipedis TaxID=2004952 RepID=A0A2C5YTN9_9HYPO|nr:hypothetical protein CDD80_5790 [Ophiocordyceps camponoti-rufipedis]
METINQPDHAIEVSLPLFVQPGQTMNPPLLASFREHRSEGNQPHMYQARLILSSIDGVVQDPRSPPPIDTVLTGEFATALTVKMADKLWFLFDDISFKPDTAGHYYKFAVQLWTCWYDRPRKSWQPAIYQCEVETGSIACCDEDVWAEEADTREWDAAQVQSIRELASRQPPATVTEMTTKFPRTSLHQDLLQGPWASPDRPSKRTG